MAPSGGGANLAVYDGAELAKAIVAHVDVEAALLAYEAELFSRSTAEAMEADRIQEVLFGDNSPRSLLDSSLRISLSTRQPVIGS